MQRAAQGRTATPIWASSTTILQWWSGLEPGSFSWGPLVNVAGVAFFPGCGGASKAAVGRGGGPRRTSRHSLLLLEANPFLPQLLSEGKRWARGRSCYYRASSKFKHTYELNVVPRGTGTTSGEVLRERGLRCTPLLRLTSSGSLHQRQQVKAG